jgi:hypothetical protein
MDDDTLQELYQWVDEIPLSRPKRNITRDFSDGVLVAEIVSFFFPKLVELHNYSPANSSKQKLYNWTTLQSKVFKKLKFKLSDADRSDIVKCRPGVVEKMLVELRGKIERRQRRIAQGLEPAPGRAQMRSRGAARPKSGQTRDGDVPPRPGRPNGGFRLDGPLPPASFGDVRASMQTQSGRGGLSPGGRGAYDAAALQKEVDTEILVEKEQTIHELRETVEILELKISKLEQLVRLKDGKIAALSTRLQRAGLS